MRSLRLFLLGLASIYPIYWTAQFALFFLPAAVRSLFLQTPLTVVDISFFQAIAATGKPDALPIGFEPLVATLLISLAIWYLRGDAFLTGSLAMVVMGQSALMPFLSEFWRKGISFESLFGIMSTMGIICFGLHRILRRTGGIDFVDRLALLSLLAVFPEALLWFTFRLNSPDFGAKLLLMLLIPLYVSALLVSAVSHPSPKTTLSAFRKPVPVAEILACVLVACLLFTAIGLTTYFTEHRGSPAAQATPVHGR
jgi:hypothetical protein